MEERRGKKKQEDQGGGRKGGGIGLRGAILASKFKEICGQTIRNA